MTLWNKIVLGTKFLFGGFESATDYLLNLLNEFLLKENVAENVQKTREYVVTILGYLKKYEKYCPAIWAVYYEKLENSVQAFGDILQDGKVTSDEVEKVKAAIADWMK